MKETLQCIRDRRSCRSYLPEQIKEEELQVLLDAAILAPSAKNLQQRHITVIQNAALLDELSEEILPVIGQTQEGYHVFHHAPTVLAIAVDKTAGWGREDVGILCENVCLAAESIGLGTCMLGLPYRLFSRPEGAHWHEKLQAPAGYEVLMMISVGYKAQSEIPARPRNRDVVSYLK